jgi:hypothetical protein
MLKLPDWLDKPLLWHREPRPNWRQAKKVRSHPWIAKEVPVRGFVLDMDGTGRAEAGRSGFVADG